MGDAHPHLPCATAAHLYIYMKLKPYTCVYKVLCHTEQIEDRTSKCTARRSGPRNPRGRHYKFCIVFVILFCSCSPSNYMSWGFNISICFRSVRVLWFPAVRSRTCLVDISLAVRFLIEYSFWLRSFFFFLSITL